MNTLTFLEGVLRDLRYALRMIRTKPGFSVPALLSLALGIGANVAIFSVVNAVLIRPLPYPSRRNSWAFSTLRCFQGRSSKDGPSHLACTLPIRKTHRSFEEFGVWTAGAATITGIGDPEQIPTVSMTHGVLRALGVRPYLGRWFSSADEMQGAQKTVILSYKYWQERFGGDAGVLGRLVLIDFVPHQVIGVMPQDFEFLNLNSGVFLPQSVGQGVPGSNDADHSGIARLKSGVSLAQANQDIARILRIWGAQEGWGQYLISLRVKPNIHPLKQDVIGDVGAVLKI